MSSPVLSMYQRAVLANQYRILEVLVPNDADQYRSAREALEYGYEGFYQYIGIHHESTDPPLTESQTSEVVEILNMHRSLHYSYTKLADKGSIKPIDVQFRGWGGNDECALLSFTRWFCDVRDPHHPAYTELERNCEANVCTDFKGASPQLTRYREMLVEWKKTSKTGQLSLAEIQRIVDAGAKRNR